MISTSLEKWNKIKMALPKEHLIWYLFNMLHNEQIGIHAAYELAEEANILDGGWLTLEYEISNYLNSLE